MNWNKDKSILLSKICTVGFSLALAVICVSYAVSILNKSPAAAEIEPYYTAALAAVAVPAYIALWQLYRMLHSISRGLVFIPENVRCLRVISWCCFAAAAVFLICGFCGGSWVIYFTAAAAAFGGVVLRVVKNVFAAAVELKADNDLTI